MEEKRFLYAILGEVLDKMGVNLLIQARTWKECDTEPEVWKSFGRRVYTVSDEIYERIATMEYGKEWDGDVVE